MAAQKIMFGAYNPYTSPVTEEKVKLLAGAGMDIAIISYSGSDEDFRRELALLDKYGVKAIVHDSRAQKIYKKLIAGSSGVFDIEKV